MKIKMNFTMMRDMKAACQKSAEEVEAVIDEIKKIASCLEEGGLIGEAGTAYVNALNGVLTKKVVIVRDKFEELGRDLQKAMDSITQADRESGDIIGL